MAHAETEVGELNRRLYEHSEALLKDSKDYAKLARKAVDARNNYDVAKAKARLIVRTDPAFSGWSVAEKDAQALLLCEAEMIEARVCEAHLESQGKRLRAVEASLSAVQSQARLLSTESQLNNYRT